MIPDATQSVFISPYGLNIGGAQMLALDLQLMQPGDYFGIRFYPGALRYFFNINLSEITDQFVDNQFFPCRDFGSLHQDIYQCDDFIERKLLCENWLLKHFKVIPKNSFDHALKLIYQSAGNMRVKLLAELVGCSPRHLNRLFSLHTGMSSKSFIQIIRLQKACKQLHAAPSESLNTAMELGYFDQSHLINDYKQRLLLPPSLFSKRFMSDFYNI
jgi:AraC-like DNA-binding protein